jgi:Cu/Ag efflux protein CusF
MRCHKQPSCDETGYGILQVAATGMITLKHGAFANLGMAPMTMAYKAKDAAMVRQAHAGDKVKVRVEAVGGTLTIVEMVKDAS